MLHQPLLPRLHACPSLVLVPSAYLESAHCLLEVPRLLAAARQLLPHLPQLQAQQLHPLLRTLQPALHNTRALRGSHRRHWAGGPSCNGFQYLHAPVLPPLVPIAFQPGTLAEQLSEANRSCTCSR